MEMEWELVSELMLVPELLTELEPVMELVTELELAPGL